MPWTYSYPIPIDCYNSIETHSHLCCKKIGSKLYIITNTAYEAPEKDRMDIFVFDTKTNELESVSYEVPEVFGDTLMNIETDGKDVYLWRDCFSTLEPMLFKFDVTTRNITYIASVESRQMIRNCPIIDDQMYAWGWKNGSVHLLTISLSKNEVVNEMDLGQNRSGVIQYIDKVGNAVYMYEQIDNFERKVYKIVNGELLELSQDTFAKKDELKAVSIWRDGLIIYKKNSDTMFCIDTFNFEKLTWSRRETVDDPWSCSKGTRWQKEELVDGVPYTILKRLDSEYAEYELRVFDNLPKLSTKCYLNIVEEVMKKDNYEELEKVKNTLHHLMSYELDELIGWRKREKAEDKKGEKTGEGENAESVLQVTQIKAMIEEIIFMEREQIIESDVAESFFDLFDALNVFGI